MWSRSHRAASTETVELAAPKRRRHHRQKLRNLAYVKVDSNNGGILLDIGESGMATRVLAPLSPDQPVRLRVDLADPRVHLEADGRVAWINSTGLAGIEFLDPSPRSARLLREWLFTQLLADAHRLRGNTADELQFSAAARPAIRLDKARQPASRPLRLLWMPVSAHGFARLVDGLALLCAVLLFSVLSLSLIDMLPSWPIAAALLFGVSGIFALLYGFLFSLWFKTTPGRRLAEMAGRASAGRILKKEDQARFR
ncbi:MAG: PilZ domain-containing protein [Terriglobales bacterium]|jgi:PilZ domain-containing protein